MPCNLPSGEEILYRQVDRKKVWSLFFSQVLLPNGPRKSGEEYLDVFMPVQNIFRESRIQHIPMDIVAWFTFLLQYILSQQRRNHTDVLMIVFRHGAEGEGQFLWSSQCSQSCKEIQEKQAAFVLFWVIWIGCEGTGTDDRYRFEELPDGKRNKSILLIIHRNWWPVRHRFLWYAD